MPVRRRAATGLGQDLDDVQQAAGQRAVKLDGHVVTARHGVDLVVARYDRRHRRTAGGAARAGGITIWPCPLLLTQLTLSAIKLIWRKEGGHCERRLFEGIRDFPRSAAAERASDIRS